MRLTKMHGLGNDFVLVDDMGLAPVEPSTLAKAICSRRTGIGADGLILAQPSKIADIKMRIFNSDGSEAEMCGNGIRCFALFAAKNHLVTATGAFTVETLAGIMRPEIVELHDNNNIASVRVNMGAPAFTPEKIPMNYDGSDFVNKPYKNYKATALLMGVPHLIIHADTPPTRAELIDCGSAAQTDPLFPEGINVDFVYTQGGEYHMRTYERGCGITCACGTGTCAAAVALSEAGFIPKLGMDKAGVNISLMLGKLFIERDDDGNVFMTGPAEAVFETEANFSEDAEKADSIQDIMSEWLG